MVYPYIPHTDEDRKAMLDAIGAGSIEELYRDVGEDILLSDSVPISQGRSEDEVIRMLQSIGERNQRGVPFLGAGCYDHIIPATVDAISHLPSFLTANAPSQEEISQGLLQVFFEFQSMICQITGMDASNASTYDAANALTQAAGICLAARKGRHTLLVSPTIHPFALSVLRTWASHTDHVLVMLPQADGLCDLSSLESALSDDVAGVLVQSPNRYGFLEDYTSVAETMHKAGALLCVSSDPMSVGLQKSQREWGADIAVGDTQPFGLPMSFGGPSCGYLAVTKPLSAFLPGVVVGQTKDERGKRAFVLASHTNADTNSLAALRTTVYLSLVGWQGVKDAAWQCYVKSHYLQSNLAELGGVELAWDHPFWCEFPLRFHDAKRMRKYIQELRNEGLFAGVRLQALTHQPEDELVLLVSVTEKRSREEMETYLAAARRVLR
jgi:glycine dehydrogenase subunit 1